MTWATAVVAGAAPHPAVQVLTAPEVVSAAATLVVAMLGWVTWRLRRAQTLTEATVARVGVHAARAAVAAEQAADQTTNDHGTNLRDDVDGLRDLIATVLARLDTAETARQADEAERRAEAAEVARRMARTEAQLDGLRDDVRAIDGRLTHLDEQADVEHARLREEIHARERLAAP